jgi:hypothetical protein
MPFYFTEETGENLRLYRVSGYIKNLETFACNTWFCQASSCSLILLSSPFGDHIASFMGLNVVPDILKFITEIVIIVRSTSPWEFMPISTVISLD